jgi:hypothetical protein
MYNVKTTEPRTKNGDRVEPTIKPKAELPLGPADAEAFAPEPPEGLVDFVLSLVVVAEAIVLDKDVATVCVEAAVIRCCVKFIFH